jgi:DNA primase
MMYDNTELDEAIATLDIESWLDQEGVEYRQARGSSGRQANVKTCPCCGNSKWKVYIGLETGFGNCFSGDCERKFNKFTFIGAQLGLSGKDTVEYIKTFARGQGWKPARKSSVAVNLMSSDLKLPASIAMPHEGRNLKYLENRNITGAIAKYFNLRFSMRGKFNYTDERGKRLFQNYANRIIIPIFDLEGDLVSFQGRDITGTADKKYLFPPGFSSTGTHLFNSHNAVGAARIVIGEGVFDVFALKIALDADMGLRDVVPIGSFGKHLSHDDDASQLAKIMHLKDKGLEQVTIMWDSEPAALTAAVETGLRLTGCGIQTRIAVLPAGCDPNETSAANVQEAFWKADVVTPLVATRLLLQAKRLGKVAA